MNEFLFLFRNDYDSVVYKQSPEQMQGLMQQWMDWMGSMAAQNKLADKGNRLGLSGTVVKPGKVVTDGPYAELKELVGGYIMVRAASLEEATEMAKGCPILNIGGSVEVRGIISMD